MRAKTPDQVLLYRPPPSAVYSSVTTNPATEADVSVAKTPEISAETANLLTSPPRPGAICDRIPIWIPREPMLPKPHSAYVAMRRDRGERAPKEGSVVRVLKATYSFW
jgi:hypothetical protein